MKKARPKETERDKEKNKDMKQARPKETQRKKERKTQRNKGNPSERSRQIQTTKKSLKEMKKAKVLKAEGERDKETEK